MTAGNTPQPRGPGLPMAGAASSSSHLPRRKPSCRSCLVAWALARRAIGRSNRRRCRRRCRRCIRRAAGRPRGRAHAPPRIGGGLPGFESSCGHAPFLAERAPESGARACELPHAGGATIWRERYCLRPSDCSACPSGGTASGRRDYGVASAPAVAGESLITLTTPQAISRFPQCPALPAIATPMAAPGAISAWNMPSGCRIAKLIGETRSTPTGETMER